MCMQYPEIIITSPTEPAAFCAVPETIEENLLTTNYEQWCALYSMNEDDISLAFVSSSLLKHRKQRYEEEEDFEYGEEYRYEYDDFEDDDFFDKYQQSKKRQTLGDEFNSYNETHNQKYEGYDNNDYDYYFDYEDNEDEEGFDYEYEYDSDEDYDDVDDYFYMEKKQVSSASRPRLNLGILANAINRRFNKTTDSDVSEEEEIDEFETETIETKVIIKNTPTIKLTSEIPIRHCDVYPEEPIESNNKNEEMFDYIKTINSKFNQKEVSSSVQSKSSISLLSDIFSDQSFGKPEVMSNKHGGRKSFLTHKKSNSLQACILKKALNENNFTSMIEDCKITQNSTSKHRRSFSLNDWNDFIF